MNLKQPPRLRRRVSTKLWELHSAKSGTDLKKTKNKIFAERWANQSQYSVDKEHSSTGN